MLKKLSIVLGAVALVAVGYTAVDIVAPDQTAVASLVGSAFAGQGQGKRWARHLRANGSIRCVLVTGANAGSSCFTHDDKHSETIHTTKQTCINNTTIVACDPG